MLSYDNGKIDKLHVVILNSDEDGFWWVHCMSRGCDQSGKNSIVMANKDNDKAIAENWLFFKLTEYDWRKKDAQAWLDTIWHEYNQYLYDNQ